jgi:hypothetical protein
MCGSFHTNGALLKEAVKEFKKSKSGELILLGKYECT